MERNVDTIIPEVRHIFITFMLYYCGSHSSEGEKGIEKPIYHFFCYHIRLEEAKKI